MSVKDGDNSNSTGYTPVASGSNILVAAHANQKKKHQRMRSVPRYMRTIEVMLLAYVMASTLGDAGREWMHFDVAQNYLAKLRKLERLDALSDPNIWHYIAECETQTRNEWRDKNLADPSISLGDIISLSLEQGRFPDASKFTPAKMPRGRAAKNQNPNGFASQSPTPREAYPKFASDRQGSYRRKRGDKESSTRGPKGAPTWKKISATETDAIRALMASRVNMHTIPLRWRPFKHALKPTCGYKLPI